jgi:ribosomal protein S18 acetylase RimI-like enzyme
MSATVRRATSTDLEAVVPLFDGYRRFYGKESDPALSRRFLAERFDRNDSVVLIAERPDGQAVGFVQLYPSFSSVRAGRIYILNDLFVLPAARGSGTGASLLRAAAEAAHAAGAIGMKLSTAVTNLAAQRLYEAAGWKRDEDFYEYGLAL